MSPKLNSSKLIAVRSDLTTIAIRHRGKNMKHHAHRIYNVTRMFQFSNALHAYLQKQPPKVFCKKTVLKKFEKLSRKHLCLSLFLINIVDVQLYKKQTSTQVLYCKICENFKNRTPLMLIVAPCSKKMKFETKWWDLLKIESPVSLYLKGFKNLQEHLFFTRTMHVCFWIHISVEWMKTYVLFDIFPCFFR